jgi:hypothetical protein
VTEAKTDKTLVLDIQSLIIRHLGIQMYQKPADVISEMVANAWDADAEKVDVKISQNSIEIIDNGNGMTFDECQKYYLKVGRDRREDTGKDTSSIKNRPVLGRKGIGKFAGFGIANIITVDTISRETGEKTVFRMDLEKIYNTDKQGEAHKEIEILEFIDPNDSMKNKHSTKIALLLKTQFNIDTDRLVEELGRRFLLTQQYSDFKVYINDTPISSNFSQDLEYVFPRDLSDEEMKKFPNIVKREGEWAVENFKDKSICWRIGYFEDTIKIEELRGVAIYVRGKLAQKSFFFDLSGGISAQNSLEYLTGQVKIDFIDSKEFDLISTERQRINIQDGIGMEIKSWGQELIKKTGAIWKERRAQERVKQLEDKVGPFKERLDKLSSVERKTVKSVLLKIANFDRLGKGRFEDWCNDILTSWETGRLRGLINNISERNEIDETQMLEILYEAQILTALNIAESIKTKIVTIAELKKRVENKDLENSIRDYIYENPWLIHPKWETFKKERYIDKLLGDIGAKHLDTDGVFSGRVDLTLSSDNSLLLIEFMRPGLKIDRDHLDRLGNYVSDIVVMLKHETGSRIKKLSGSYIIADERNDDIFINEKIQKLESDNIYFLTWNNLINEAKRQWEEQLDILKQNNRTDPRIQAL